MYLRSFLTFLVIVLLCVAGTAQATFYEEFNPVDYTYADPVAGVNGWVSAGGPSYVYFEAANVGNYVAGASIEQNALSVGPDASNQFTVKWDVKINTGVYGGLGIEIEQAGGGKQWYNYDVLASGDTWLWSMSSVGGYGPGINLGPIGSTTNVRFHDVYTAGVNLHTLTVTNLDTSTVLHSAPINAIIVTFTADPITNLKFTGLDANSDHFVDNIYLNVTLPAGDLSGDGWIDEDDAALLTGTWGFTSADGGWNAAYDLDGNGRIGLGDAAIVRDSWNPDPGAASVPEPGSLALLMMGSFALLVLRRRCRI